MGNLGRAGYGATLEGLVSLQSCNLSQLLDSSQSGLTLTMLVTSALFRIKPSTVCRWRLPLAVIKVKEVSYPFYQASVYQGVHVQEKVTPAPNIQMAPLLEGRLLKSMFLRPR